MVRRRIRAPSFLARRAGWLALVLWASGCGPRFGDVSGTVTYQGKPVPGGTIVFYDAANNAPSAEIKPDGSYSVSKVAAGRAKVVVIAPMAINFQGPAGLGSAAPAPAKSVPLPAKYADPAQSGLTLEVRPGNQKHDVPLE